MRMTAIVMKKGPAAPVTLFAHRSRVLKQPNTHFVQIMVANIALSSQDAFEGGCGCCKLISNAAVTQVTQQALPGSSDAMYVRF